MAHFKQIIAAVGAIALLTSCQPASPPDAAGAPPDAPPGAPPPGAPPAGAPGNAPVTAEFQELAGVISRTKAAIDSGDFAKTGEEFKQFDGAWQKVKAGVEAKSPEMVKAIEDAQKNLTAAIKAGEKEKMLQSLKILGDSVLAAGKP
jgi:hypothetical protein